MKRDKEIIPPNRRGLKKLSTKEVNRLIREQKNSNKKELSKKFFKLLKKQKGKLLEVLQNRLIVV